MNKISKYILKLIILLFFLIALVAGLAWWANNYIHSEKFSSKVTDYVNQMEGLDVERLSKITIKSYYPNITIEISKVSLKSINEYSEYKIHLDRALIKGNMDFIRSKGTQGKINITAKSVRVSEKYRETDDYVISNYYDLISKTVANINGLEFSVTTENFKFLSINLDATDSADYSLNNVSLRKKNNKLQLQYSFDDEKSLIHDHTFDDLELKSSTIGTKYSFLEKNGKEINNYRIDADISITNNEIKLSELKIANSYQNMNGNIVIEQKDKPLIKGKLLYEVKNHTNKQISQEQTSYHHSQRLIPADILPFKYLNKFDADISILIPEIQYRGSKIFSGKIRFVLLNNKLQIKSEKSKLLKGPIKATFEVDSNLDPPTSKVSIKGFNHSLPASNFRQNNVDIFGSGTFDLIANLKLEGNSLTEMFEKSNGFIEFSSSNILIKDYLNQVLFSSGLSFLTSSNSNNKNTNRRSGDNREGGNFDIETTESAGIDLLIPCLSGSFYIADGYMVSQDGIILDSGKGLIIGTGIIDFHSEKILFDNDNQNISLVDLTPLAVLNYFSIRGTLLNPEIIINRSEAIQKGLTTAAALTFGFVPSLALRAIQKMNKANKNKFICTPEIF